MGCVEVDERHGTADLGYEQCEVGSSGVIAVERRGAPGDLELDQITRTEPHHSAPWHAPRQRGRSRIADDVDGIGAVVEAQRQSQVGVGPDVIVDHARRPLRREHEVHPETPAALGDPDQRGDEVGEVDGEGRELVDHDGEARQRATRRPPDGRRGRWRRTVGAAARVDAARPRG